MTVLQRITRLPTSIYTSQGVKLHSKLQYYTLKHHLNRNLIPYNISAKCKAIETMLTSPCINLGEFDEIIEVANSRYIMNRRKYFTPAPTTHKQLIYHNIPNKHINNKLHDTVLIDCTDSTVDNNTEYAVLYLHGGAYVGGSIESHGPFACHISHDLQCKLYFLEYNCAPEYSLDYIKQQAIQAYQYMIDKLNIKPENIIIAGDSAGGGLTILTIQSLHKYNLQQPKAAAVIAPWGDMSNTIKSRFSRAKLDKTLCQGVLVSAAQLATGYSYSAKLDNIDLTTSQYSPINGHFNNLCPLHVTVGTHEVLYDDSIVIAQKYREHSLDVTLKEYDYMFHNFPLYHQLCNESKLAYLNIIEWCKLQFNTVNNTKINKQHNSDTVFDKQSNNTDTTPTTRSLNNVTLVQNNIGKVILYFIVGSNIVYYMC